jgi:hypothetical protein
MESRKRLAWTSAIIGVLLLATSTTSHAEAPPPGRTMLVVLVDGSRVEGTLVEVEPGDRCVVQRPGRWRQRVVIPWGRIARIVPPGTPEPTPAPRPPPAALARAEVELASTIPQSGSTGPTPESAPTQETDNDTSQGSAPPPPPPPASPPPSRDGVERSPRRVVLEIHASSPVKLQQSVGAGDWQTVCASPCNEPQRVDAAYRIVDASGDVRKGFRIDPDSPEKIEIEVSLASPVVTGLGVTAVVAGTIAFYVGVAAAGEGSAGGPIALLGAVGGTVGAIALALNHTSVDQHPARDPGNAKPTAFTTDRARRDAELEALRPRSVNTSLITLHF